MRREVTEANNDYSDRSLAQSKKAKEHYKRFYNQRKLIVNKEGKSLRYPKPRKKKVSFELVSLKIRKWYFEEECWKRADLPNT